MKEKAPTTQLDEEASDIEDELELTHRINTFGNNSEPQSSLNCEQLEKIIAQLNEELKNKTEQEIDWRKYPKLFIAQYRGIHYYRSHFTKNQRADHRSTIHLNRIAPAPAVYHMSSLSPIQHQLARESVVHQHRTTIQETFDQLEQSGPIKQYWRGKVKNEFKNASDMLQQRMSNSYNSFREDILQHKQPVTKLLYDRNIIGYPHYATSDLPLHALKYAYGQKKIDGLTEWRLRPIFQQTGKPLHPCPGKIFISMFTPLQMYLYKTRHVPKMPISLLGTVIPERETSIPGGVDAEAPFYEELLVIPSFEKFDKNYESQYGFTQKHFAIYKKEIEQSCENKDASLRKKVKNKIIEKFIEHKVQESLRLAQNEAKYRGGYLIYRHDNGKYGLNPEVLRIPSKKQPSYTKEENLLLRNIGEERFDNKSQTKNVTDDKINPKKRKSNHYPDTVSVSKRPTSTASQEIINVIKRLTFELFKNYDFNFKLEVESLNRNLQAHGLTRGTATSPRNNCLLHSYFQQIEIFIKEKDILISIEFNDFVHYVRKEINKTNNQMLSANDEQEGIAILKAIQKYLYNKCKRNFGFNLEIFVADRDSDFAIVDNLAEIQQQFNHGEMMIPLRIIQVNYNHYEPVFIDNVSLKNRKFKHRGIGFFEAPNIDTNIFEKTNLEKAKQVSLDELPTLEQANRILIEQINQKSLVQGVDNSLQDQEQLRASFTK